jgi:hypothetical protein
MSGPSGARTMAPVAVVVDTRNMHGTAASVLGVPGRPVVSGVKAALAMYGMDAVELAFGIATKPAGRPSARRESALASNQTYATDIAQQGGRLLEGSLQDPGPTGPLTEKQVDVLCAVEVISMALRIKAGTLAADAIVVLSGDKDIEPAMVMVRAQMGVPVYAAAATSVTNRPAWVLLTERAVAQMVGSGVQGGLVGEARRRQIVAAATSPGAGAAWSRHTLGDGGVVLRSQSGLQGRPAPGASSPSTTALTMYCCGVDVARSFPEPVLHHAPQPQPSTLRTGLVLRRVDALAVRVQVGGQERRVAAPVGYPAVGATVLLHEDIRGSRFVYVGTVQDPSTSALGTDPRVVRVEGLTKFGDAVVRLPGGGKAVMKAPRHMAVSRGQRFAAVEVQRLNTGQLLLWAVSSPLP